MRNLLFALTFISAFAASAQYAPDTFKTSLIEDAYRGGMFFGEVFGQARIHSAGTTAFSFGAADLYTGGGASVIIPFSRYASPYLSAARTQTAYEITFMDANSRLNTFRVKERITAAGFGIRNGGYLLKGEFQPGYSLGLTQNWLTVNDFLTEKRRLLYSGMDVTASVSLGVRAGRRVLINLTQGYSRGLAEDWFAHRLTTQLGVVFSSRAK